MTKLLDLMGLNPIRPQIFYGGDKEGGGGGGGSDDGGGSTFGQDVMSGTTTDILPPPSQGNIRPVSRKEKSDFAKVQASYKDNNPRAVKSTNPNGKTTYAMPNRVTAMAAEPGARDPRIVNSYMDDMINRLTPFDNKERRGGQVYDTNVANPNVDQAFQDRFMQQRIAAAADPYGQSTERGVNLTSGQPLSYTDGDGKTQTIAGEGRANAQKMLADAGLTGQEYVDAVLGLGTKLDEPRFGPFSGMPALQGIDYLADMDQRRAYEQLTGSYEPSGIAKALGISNSATARYVPVMEGGQVVGSLSVDADGNPLSYTGSRSDTAKVMDPTIDQDAAMAKIGAPQVDPNFPTNKSDDGPGISQPGPAVAGVAPTTIDPCPVGYMMDPATNACVIDPNDVFNRPEIQVQTPAMPAASYTAAGAYTLPTLAPPVQPNFVVPTPNIQPITVAQQGLASLPFRTS